MNVRFATVWLPAGSPDLESARAWLESVEDRQLLEPGSLGWAPHQVVDGFGMDVPDDEELLDALMEGHGDQGWFETLGERLGPEHRQRYLALARQAIAKVLEDLDSLDYDDITDVLLLANGRLVMAAYESQHAAEGHAMWLRRLEMLEHTCPRSLSDAAAIVFLDGQAQNWSLVRS